MPPTRPTHWLTRRRLLWSTFAVITLLILWQAYDIITGKPRPSIDYVAKFNELRASVQPDGDDDAMDLLTTVLDRFSAVKSKVDEAARDAGDAGDDLYFESLYVGPFREQAWPTQLSALNTLRDDGTLALSAKMAATNRCIFPPVTGSSLSLQYINQSVAALGSLRDYAKVQAARMRVAAHAQDWPDFIAAVDESLAAAQFASREPALLPAINAIAVQLLILEQLRYALVDYQLDESTALTLREVIGKRLDVPDCAFAVAGERMIALDQLQCWYTPSGRISLDSFNALSGDSFFPRTTDAAKGDVASTLGAAMAVAFPGRSTAKRLVNDCFDDLARLSQLPLSKVQKLNSAGWLIHVPMNQVAVGRSLHDPTNFSRLFITRRASLQATRLLLAIEAYQGRNGHAPGSLDEPHPDFITANPNDPVCDKPYHYKRLDGDEHQRPFLLWSCGIDEEDNGGTPIGHKGWWNGPPGTDWIINAPREDFETTKSNESEPQR